MNPLEAILNEVEKAIASEHYYAALSVTLSLPEICARMEQNDRTKGKSKKLYTDWFRDNVKEKYRNYNLTGDDCYYLRCGVAHNGRFSNRNLGYERIVFTLPDGKGNVFHNNIMKHTLNLDLVQFCTDVLDATRQWLEQNKDNDTVKKHLEDMVSVRSGGLSPFIQGVPGIAIY